MNEGFVPKRGTVLSVARLLDGLFIADSFKPGSTRIVLDPRELHADIVRCRDGYLSFYAVVEEFGVPEPVADDVAQRFCRACGALVPTWAECRSCGVEEDPGTWRLGPPVILYSRAFELALNIRGGPDVWAEGDAAVEAAARRYLGPALEAIADHLGTALRCVRCVWA